MNEKFTFVSCCHLLSDLVGKTATYKSFLARPIGVVQKIFFGLRITLTILYGNQKHFSTAPKGLGASLALHCYAGLVGSCLPYKVG